jgi:hypothetical protein
MMFLRVLHVAWHVQKDKSYAVHVGDMEVLSLAYVIGTNARQVLCGVSCDACRMCLTSEALLPNVFIYFNGISNTEQSLTQPEKLVETVGTAGTLMESKSKSKLLCQSVCLGV